jgi:citrate lyase subunit beta/citryl-CoA lyase
MLINSYFFVPANKEKFIKKSTELQNIGCRIFDMEDSVSENEISVAFKNLTKYQVLDSDWVRLPLDSNFIDRAERIIELGISKFVLPKTTSIKEFNSILEQLIGLNKQVQIIILIETAHIYFRLEDLLQKWHENIYGFGLGSHDFVASTKLVHSDEVLMPLRLNLSLLASMYNLKAIDIASMNFSNKEEFEHEIKSAFDLGYRAKFILHPTQLEYLNQYRFFTEQEFDDAREILSIFEKNLENDEVIATYKGKIYEKPHLDQLTEKVEWGNKFYGSNR